jgi:crossover junction endodeoxyribonuclease RuvC
LRYVASGTIKTTHLERSNLPARLKVLFDGVREVVQRYQPDAASVEIVFVNVNPQATLLLGQARGACLTALVSSDLPVAEYTALQMKKAVAGYGKAGKSEVQQMVMRGKRCGRCPGPRHHPRPCRAFRRYSGGGHRVKAQIKRFLQGEPPLLRAG